MYYINDYTTIMYNHKSFHELQLNSAYCDSFLPQMICIKQYLLGCNDCLGALEVVFEGAGNTGIVSAF